MGWGERSCLKPCRCPHNCRIETCNVDCIHYVWDEVTKPDSKKTTKLSETKTGMILREFGLDKGYLDSILREDDKLHGLDLEFEYNLIKEKKSKLPSNIRHSIIVRYERLSRKDCI